MLLSEKFKGKKEFERIGVCSKIIYDDKLNIESKIDNDNKTVIVGNKSKSFVITEEIGIKGSLVCSIILVKGGMLVGVEEGLVYLRSRNDSVYTIDNEGDITVVANEDIVWKTVDDIIDYLTGVVRAKFYLDNYKEDLRKYVNNLAYTVKMEGKETPYEFRFKLEDSFDTLCLGELEIVDHSSERPIRKSSGYMQRGKRKQEDNIDIEQIFEEIETRNNEEDSSDD